MLRFWIQTSSLCRSLRGPASLRPLTSPRTMPTSRPRPITTTPSPPPRPPTPGCTSSSSNRPTIETPLSFPARVGPLPRTRPEPRPPRSSNDPSRYLISVPGLEPGPSTTEDPSRLSFRTRVNNYFISRRFRKKTLALVFRRSSWFWRHEKSPNVIRPATKKIFSKTGL